MNLALAQQRAGDYVAAEASYQRVIQLIETSGRRASPRLARAHAGLATTYYAAGRYDLAAASLEHAIALNRRSEGLFNEAQLPLLEKQADSLTELGRFEEALAARRYALRLVSSKHGERSLAYARELESLGRWYTRVGSYEASRTTLRNAGQLVVALDGANSINLIGPLTAYAENARRWVADPRLQEAAPVDPDRGAMFHDAVMPAPPSLAPGTIASEGQKALEQAVAIVDARPDASPALVVGVRVQLGDWYRVRLQPERALPCYRQAWQAAGAAPDGAALQKSLFGAPVLLHYLAPDGWDRYAQRPPDQVVRRAVELELTVTAQGEVSNPRAVSGAADPKLVTRALQAVQTARYRPRMADGEPVETTGVRFVQPFFVLLEKEKPAGPQPTETRPAATQPQPAEPPPTPGPPPQGGG
jgi:tetratricopeptide (TPR) repeat protein